jgi:hypothetical protein
VKRNYSGEVVLTLIACKCRLDSTTEHGRLASYSWYRRARLGRRLEAQGRRCNLACFVHRDNPWKRAYVIRTVSCNNTYLSTYLPTSAKSMVAVCSATSCTLLRSYQYHNEPPRSPMLARKSTQLVVGQQPSGGNYLHPCALEALDAVDVSPASLGFDRQESRDSIIGRHPGGLHKLSHVPAVFNPLEAH